jgi:hypothetical protein
MDDKTAVMPMALDIFGYSSDLADFLTGVIIKDANDNVIDLNTGVVSAGETYFLEFSFAEQAFGTGAKQFKYKEQDPNKGCLIYKLPSGVTLPTAQTQSGDIKDNTDVVTLGEYQIIASGDVTAKFKEVDIYGNSTPNSNFIDNYVAATFTLKLQAKFTGGSGDGPVKIDFGNNVIINLTVDNSPYLTVKKTAGSFNPEKRTIDYTVVVTAHGNTINDITLTDVMNISASPHSVNGTGMLSIVDTPQPSVKLDDTTTYVDAENLAAAGNGGRYKIPLGISLADGRSATVKYSVRVADAFFDNANNRFSSNAYNLNNTVTAEGKVGETSVIPATDSASAKFEITHLRKWGSLSQDGQSITWTVYAGDGYTDLRGATITDTLGTGLTIQQSGIQIKLYSDAAAENQITSITVTPQIDGNKITITVPESLIVPVKRVVITYTSTIETEQTSYSNNVQLTYKDRGYYITESASVGVGINGFNVTKTGVLTEDGNIEYTIKVNVPGGLSGRHFTIRDELAFFPFGVTDFDERVPVDNKPENAKVTIEKTNGIPLTESEKTTWELIPGDNSAISEQVENNEFIVEPAAVWFLLCISPRQPGEEPQFNPWKINEACIVTVTYTIPLTAEVKGTGPYAGMTLAEALDCGGVGNQTTSGIYNTDGEGSDSYDFIFIYKPIIKSGKKTYEAVPDTWRTEGGTGYGADDDNFYDSTLRKGFFYTVQLNPYPNGFEWDELALYDLAPDGMPPAFSDSYDPRLTLDKSSVKVYKGSVTAGNEYTVAQDKITDMPGSGDNPSTFYFDFIDAKRSGNSISFESTSKYYVTYRLLLNEDADIKPGVTKFSNVATVTIKDSGGDIRYSDDAELTYGRPIVTKTMDGKTNTTVNVEIIINPHEDTLALEGSDGTITVIDTMSRSLAFIDISNIEVTKENGDPLEFAPTLTYDSETNSVTFKGLFDKTAIKITYKALVIGEPGVPVNIANQVLIEGYDGNDVTVKDSFVIVQSSGTGSVDVPVGFYVRKTDKDNTTLLSGAVFALYVDNTYGEFDDVEPPTGIQKNIYIKNGEITDVAEGATPYFYLMWEKTSDSGMVAFNDNYILTGHTFLLVETQAPTGYVKSEKPLLLYMLTGADGEVLPADSEHIVDNQIITVTNEASQGGARFPDTGGPGTAPYILGSAGVMLIVLSAALLRTGRRRGFFYDSV